MQINFVKHKNLFNICETLYHLTLEFDKINFQCLILV